MDSEEEDFPWSDSESDSEPELSSDDEDREAGAEPVDIESNFCIDQEFSSEQVRYAELTEEEEEYVPVPDRSVFPGAIRYCSQPFVLKELRDCPANIVRTQRFARAATPCKCDDGAQTLPSEQTLRLRAACALRSPTT